MGWVWALCLVTVATWGLLHGLLWITPLEMESKASQEQRRSQGGCPPHLSEAGEGGGQAPPLTGTILPRGSALANTVSQFTLAVLLFLYILGWKLHQATWGGKETFRLPT